MDHSDWPNNYSTNSPPPTNETVDPEIFSKDPRSVRVFISSTFRDMHEEREQLVKFYFPKLRRLCEQRGIGWSEVDLRWGITNEQAAEGEVLPICLAEIERCRPYFIGMLGERYGYVPDEIPEPLKREQKWLNEHQEKSITALEIFHGVLNNPDMAAHAFFYFRDPAYVDTQSPDIQKKLRELPTTEEIETYGKEEAEQRAKERREKLAALKEEIKEKGLPVRENYKDPQELGALVYKDLKAVIDSIYPESDQPDPLDRETAEHDYFTRSRFDVYIRRPDYFNRLNEHAKGDGPPLVITGDSGSGKSALLANWVKTYREANPDDFVLLHFIGATSESTDWVAMLRRIMGELKRRFAIDQEIPEDKDDLRLAFANFLSMASAQGRTVLIIDALNQLEDRDGAPDLVWLPPVIPKNIRLVLSSLEGRALDELMSRKWPALKVEPLTTAERTQLIHDYLHRYSKTLPETFVHKILRTKHSENPLFLRAILEELRVYGDHETLDNRLDTFLAAKDIDDLFEKILARWEEDYEQERSGLVRDTMSLIWAARRGLSEQELLDLLGTEGESLPAAYWSPLSLAAENTLFSRSGLLTFFHDYMRKAVADRYLTTESEQKNVHITLADYFSDRRLEPRGIDELPWQLDKAQEWEQLNEVLGDLDFFAVAWEKDEFDVKMYWADLKAGSRFKMLDTYSLVIENPADFREYVWIIAFLFTGFGYLKEAFTLWQYLTNEALKTGDKAALQVYIGNQALILRTWGRMDEAMEFLKEKERICRELGNKAELQASIGNQARILLDWGRLDEAMELLKEQEQICKELGDKAALQVSIGNQALILRTWGRMDEAMELLKEKKRICRELGNKAELQASIGNQALILRDWGRLDEAMELLREQERICKELGDKAELQGSIGNQAVILRAWGRLDEAMELLKEKERICRELGNIAELQASIGNQAVILRAWGRLDEAMKLLKEKERICRELGNKAGLSRSIGNQALILNAWGRLDEAMELHKEEERICQELWDKEGIQVSIGNQALILWTWGRMNEAMELLKEKERICRELGNKEGIQVSIGNQALILQDWGRLDEAMELHKEEERICQELGLKDSLAISLVNQANIFANLNNLGEALSLAEEAYTITTKYGYAPLSVKIQLILKAIQKEANKR